MGFRFRVVEEVHHADALNRLLRDPVDDARRGDVRRFQDRRHDVDDMVKLRAQFALALIPLGQWITSGLRVPPKWLATCFVHCSGDAIAHAQPTGTCGSDSGPPIWSIRLIMADGPGLYPTRLATSLNVPSNPSALGPLSPTM